MCGASGDYPGALRRAHQSPGDHTAQIGNRNGEAIALIELGRVRSKRRGLCRRAGEALTRALLIFRETGARGGEAWALNHYAAAVGAAGDRPKALALYQQALAMNQELNKPDDQAISLEGIADHHLTTGDTFQGVAHLRQALEIYQRLGMSADMKRVQTRLAGLPTGRCSSQHRRCDPTTTPPTSARLRNERIS